MIDAREIAVMWAWDDGTRCVLCDLDGALELRVMRDGRLVKRQGVADLQQAITRTAPALELECTFKSTTG